MQSRTSIDQLQKNKVRSLTLLNEADLLLSNGDAEASLALFCQALIAAPGHIAVIHKIGHCLEKLGEEKDAALCYRGVVPDSVNDKFFNFKALEDRVKTADECDSVESISAFAYDSIAIDQPMRHPEDLKKYSQFSYTKTEARASFCTIATDGAFWFDGFNTVALDKNKNVIKDHIHGNEFVSLLASDNETPDHISGTVCFLDARSSRIYYHWMLDVLPKLGVLEKAGIALNTIDYFVVKANSKYQLETLAACGIPPSKILLSNTWQFYSADRAVVPYLCNNLGDKVYTGLGIGMAQWIPTYLRQLFLTAASVQGKGDVAKRIYISRSTRGSRNIANEAEVIKMLEARGFKTVEFEDYSVAGQAELMLNADVVLGVHGAGFTNLSFCKPGTKVVEIFGDYVVPCYWALSAVAKLDYAQFMATSITDESTEVIDDQVEQLRAKKILVDVEAFSDYLDSII